MQDIRKGFIGWVEFGTITKFNGELMADRMTESTRKAEGPFHTTFVESETGRIGFVFHSINKSQSECIEYFNLCLDESQEEDYD